MTPLRIGPVTRPSIDSLLDHTMRVWRFTEERGEVRETQRVPSVLHADVPCATSVKRGVLTIQDGGVVSVGQRKLYAKADVTLKERDLCELLTGPSAPAWLEVTSSDKPGGHHTEAQVQEYNGTRPEL